MKIMLLGISLESDNMGIGALAAGTMRGLFETQPHADISLLDYGRDEKVYPYPWKGVDVRIKLTNLRFSKKIYLRNHIVFLMFLALLRRITRFRRKDDRHDVNKNPRLDEILRSQWAGSIAGGDSFSDTYGLALFFYTALPQLLIVLLSKSLILLPQTVGPFRGRISRAVAGYVLKRAKLIYSRDYAGLNELKVFLGPDFDSGKLRFCYDVGFLIDPVRPNRMDLTGLSEEERSCPVVGLNISGLLYMGGYTKDNQFGLKINYRLLVEAIVDYWIKKRGAKVLLIPHVFGEDGDSESDQALCERLYQQFNRNYAGGVYLARGRYEAQEIKYIIGLCDFFIGSRMHACIAALSQGIPSVPIAYSKKFVGVMETIGVSSHVADARTMNEGQILEMIDTAFRDKELIRDHLQKRMPEVRETVLKVFAEICALFENPSCP